MSAVYFPNLRAKSGEIEGLAHLSPRSRALTSTGRFGLFGPAGGLQWSRSSRNELRVWEVGFDGWPTFREIGLARVRDKANLDIFWLKDEALEESANLPDPEVIAADIAADLEAALEQFSAIAEDFR